MKYERTVYFNDGTILEIDDYMILEYDGKNKVCIGHYDIRWDAIKYIYTKIIINKQKKEESK